MARQYIVERINIRLDITGSSVGRRRSGGFSDTTYPRCNKPATSSNFEVVAIGSGTGSIGNETGRPHLTTLTKSKRPSSREKTHSPNSSADRLT